MIFDQNANQLGYLSVTVPMPRDLLLSPSQDAVCQAALLLHRDGVCALLHDSVRVLDVLLAGSQGGESEYSNTIIIINIPP